MRRMSYTALALSITQQLAAAQAALPTCRGLWQNHQPPVCMAVCPGCNDRVPKLFTVSLRRSPAAGSS